VLRREERGQTCAAHRPQQVDGVVQPRVDRGRMGEDAEATAAQQPEAVVEEDVEAGLDAGHRARV
jgi:hypothetical protein